MPIACSISRPWSAPWCGRRLLDVSRLALERITALAMVAQITGDERYSRRAIEEMLAVIKFSDWNPSHFLDVAEMSLAVAIGYDWLYDKLTPEQRDEIAKALVDKGHSPVVRYAEPFFVQGTNNWNQVCHAGLSAAAIAWPTESLPSPSRYWSARFATCPMRRNPTLPMAPSSRGDVLGLRHHVSRRPRGLPGAPHRFDAGRRGLSGLRRQCGLHAAGGFTHRAVLLLFRLQKQSRDATSALLVRPALSSPGLDSRQRRDH